MEQEAKQQDTQGEDIQGDLNIQHSDEWDTESLSVSYESSDTTRELDTKDLLDASPPDFELAKIHQNASRVKFMSQRKVSEAFL